MTVFNDILIPHFKGAFILDFTHAMLMQFAFKGAIGHKIGRQDSWI